MSDPRLQIVQWYVVSRRNLVTDDYELGIDGVCGAGDCSALVEAADRNYQKPFDVLELHDCRDESDLRFAKTCREARNEQIRNAKTLFADEVIS